VGKKGERRGACALRRVSIGDNGLHAQTPHIVDNASNAAVTREEKATPGFDGLLNQA
jgi:hypothetical protein